MGEVWLAEQTEPVHREVAFKVIKAGMDTKQVVARFEAERQALALMDHPAIAKVLEGGSTPAGRPYFAMEYVKGEPITTYCDRQRLSTAERLELFIQVCEGVQHAHQKGIIHRDLKPSNVLVTVQDDHPVPKIIDFGVAKAVAQPLTERSLYTELGVLIGTPEYMSPEQAEMTGLDVDTRTDVYALGVLLYELLTGTLPVDRTILREKGLDEVRRTIRETDPPRPSTRITQMGPASTEAARNRHTEPARLASQLRGDLDWITMKALEKDRTRRYDTVRDLANDVGRHLRNEPVSAGPPSTPYRARKFVRRHRFGVVSVASLVTLLLTFAATMAIQAGRIAAERDRASQEALRASQEAARANREAAASQQVADFLAGLFRVSDPAEARGRAVTAREVLDRGAARIDTDLTSDPILQARLLFVMGDVYRRLGALDQAQRLLEQCVDIRRRTLGPDAADTLRASSLLGSVYDLDGKADLAERTLTSVLEKQRRLLGENHPDTLKTLANLANLLDSQGHYDKSVPMMRDVFERRRKVLGADHLDTLGSQYNLAVALYRGEHFDEAELLLTDVVRLFTRKVGTDHPNTLMAKNLLGIVYLAKKQLRDARRVFNEVYDARRRVLGPEHMDTLASQLELANVARLEGRFAESESSYRQTLTVQKRVVGPDHPDTLATQTSLATLLYEAKRFDEAARLWRDTLVRMQRTLGVDHPDTANCLVGLAEVELHRGRSDAALRLVHQAVRVNALLGSTLAADPAFAPLKHNPEFEALTHTATRR